MNNKLEEFDLKHVWHPYTSLTDPIPTYHVVKTEGTNLYLDNGKRLVDGMSSWWACLHGYGNEYIKNAIIKQLGDMSHVMFAGIRHDPATNLCKKLVDISPEGLDYVFLSDSGSVAVEIALKMAIQYQCVKRPKRTKFMTVKGGYHGDTLGAMSVTDPDGGINTVYKTYTPQQIFAPRPNISFNGEWLSEKATELRKLFVEHEHEVAAFIIEPIVQGAGGMNFYHPQYLREIRALCDEFDILFIVDEIATGFGRTGVMFASEYAQIAGDIMTVGKGLTAGFMTLSAVLCNDKVKNAISASPAKVMMHGPTFMANPLACACANASIDVLFSYDWRNAVKNIEKILLRELNVLSNSIIVKEVRVLGAIGVIELYENVNTPKMQSFFVEEGVWLRPFGNIIYIYPPFIISEADLMMCTSAVVKLIKLMEDGKF